MTTERLAEWAENVYAVSSKTAHPPYFNPGQIKSDVRDLLAEMERLREERDAEHRQRILVEESRDRLAAAARLPDGVGHWFNNTVHWYDPQSTPMPDCPLCVALSSLPVREDAGGIDGKERARRFQ